MYFLLYPPWRIAEKRQKGLDDVVGKVRKKTWSLLYRVAWLRIVMILLLSRLFETLVQEYQLCKRPAFITWKETIAGLRGQVSFHVGAGRSQLGLFWLGRPIFTSCWNFVCYHPSSVSDLAHCSEFQFPTFNDLFTGEKWRYVHGLQYAAVANRWLVQKHFLQLLEADLSDRFGLINGIFLIHCEFTFCIVFVFG